MSDWMGMPLKGGSVRIHHTESVGGEGNKVMGDRLEGFGIEGPRGAGQGSVPHPQNIPNHDGISRSDPAGFIKAVGHVIVSRDASACYLTISTGGGDFAASGGAKRNKGEEFNFQVGADLAIGRALANAGRELERRTLARIPKPKRYVIPAGTGEIWNIEDTTGREKVNSIDPDAEGNVPLDDDEARLGLYDWFRKRWA